MISKSACTGELSLLFYILFGTRSERGLGKWSRIRRLVLSNIQYVVKEIANEMSSQNKIG
jgi:predicted methyltransferase